MKIKCLIALFILSINLSAQNSIERKYYRSLSLEEVSEKKAKYVLNIKQESPNIEIYELKSILSDSIIRLETYENGVQSGVWLKRDAIGKVIGKLDYNFIINYCNEQSGNNTIKTNYTPAKFPDEDFRVYIQNHLNYPLMAVSKKMTGKINVSVTIDKEGNVSNVCITEGSNSLLGKEVIRATKASPKWIPAQESGRMIEDTFTFPVFFMIQ